MDWRSLPRAPESGSHVCALGDVPFVGTLGVDIQGFPLLVVRTEQGLYAYFNACPHQYLPLDWRAKDILSADASQLLCSNHSAGFDVSTGEGVSGHAQGCALHSIPIRVEGDTLLIGP